MKLYEEAIRSKEYDSFEDFISERYSYLKQKYQMYLRRNFPPKIGSKLITNRGFHSKIEKVTSYYDIDKEKHFYNVNEEGLKVDII